MFIPSELKERVLAVAKRLASQAITHAAGVPGNVSGKQREEIAVDYLADRAAQEVEEFDHLLPVIGAYMDLPLTDKAQRKAERLILTAFVRQVYAAQELQKLQQAA